MSDNPGDMATGGRDGAGGQEVDVDMLQADAIERKEIEGEWLAALYAKGYRLETHNGVTPCFSCSLSEIIRGLPTLEPKAAGTQTQPDRAESLDQNQGSGGSP